MDQIYSQLNLHSLYLTQEQKIFLKLAPTDFKKGTGKNAIRKIFQAVPFDLYEQQQLSMFRKENDLDVGDEILLRFLYANQFDLGLTIKNLEQHQKWLENDDNFKFTLSVEDILINGGVYVAARGKGQKPVIVVNTDILDINRYSMEDITRAIIIILMIVKKCMFEPGLVETWVLLIEAKESSAFKIPFSSLGNLFQTFRGNFPCYLERIFILSPQTSVQVIWQIVEQFIPQNSRHKIEFISKNLALLSNSITLDQLQIKHGGKMQNIYDYWPPSIINSDFDYEQDARKEQAEIQKQLNEMKNIVPYSSKISQQIQNLLQKKHKPKNKIYQEETYIDHSEYYREKQSSKTVFLKQVQEQPRLDTQTQAHTSLQQSRFIKPKNKPQQDLQGFRFLKSTVQVSNFGGGSHNVSIISKHDDVFAQLHDSQFV